jgi:archaellum component FlaC
MSTQIRDTVSDIFSGVSQQICHYHFVGNLEKLIFKGRYEKLRKLVLDTHILHQLGALKKKVSKDCSRNDLVSGERKWVALAIEYLLWPREIPSGYPFVLPYFEIMNRVLEISGLIRRIVRWNAKHNLAVRAVLDLSEKLKGLTATHELQMQYYHIKKIYGWFEDVRKDLGVSRHLSGNGQKAKPTGAKEVKERLEKTLARIETEGREMGGDLQAAAEKIVGEFQGHGDEFIEEVKDKSGNTVKILRHNGIEELGHRWSRMHTRRRTGRSRTTKEMAKYGALLAVLSNLGNEEYVKEVLAKVKNFVYEMQNITPEEIKEAKRLIKPHQEKLLVRSDKKRAVLLQEFVEILERPESNTDAVFKSWFSKLAESNPKMTP